MQFSLKSMFLMTAAVAVLFGVVFALPDVVAIPLMMYITLILPGATIALVVYGRGYLQAFAIGCLASPVGPALVAIPYLVAAVISDASSDASSDTLGDQGLVIKLGILAYHFMNISCGLIAVAARWLSLRSKTSKARGQAKVLEELIVERISPSTDEPYALIHGRVGASENGSDRLEREDLQELGAGTPQTK